MLMASTKPDNTAPRFIPPGACSWCGHDPHPIECRGKIRTLTAAAAKCPCSKRVA